MFTGVFMIDKEYVHFIIDVAFYRYILVTGYGSVIIIIY